MKIEAILVGGRAYHPDCYPFQDCLRGDKAIGAMIYDPDKDAHYCLNIMCMVMSMQNLAIHSGTTWKTIESILPIDDIHAGKHGSPMEPSDVIIQADGSSVLAKWANRTPSKSIDVVSVYDRHEFTTYFGKFGDVYSDAIYPSKDKAPDIRIGASMTKPWKQMLPILNGLGVIPEVVGNHLWVKDGSKYFRSGKRGSQGLLFFDFSQVTSGDLAYIKFSDMVKYGDTFVFQKPTGVERYRVIPFVEGRFLFEDEYICDLEGNSIRLSITPQDLLIPRFDAETKQGNYLYNTNMIKQVSDRPIDLENSFIVIIPIDGTDLQIGFHEAVRTGHGSINTCAVFRKGAYGVLFDVTTRSFINSTVEKDNLHLYVYYPVQEIVMPVSLDNNIGSMGNRCFLPRLVHITLN